MRIGYDGKRAVNNLTGLGNYSRLVVESLARRFPDETLIMYAPAARNNPRLAPLLELPNVELRLPEGNGILSKGAVWRTFSIPRQLRNDRIDLFHGLSNELPLTIRNYGIPSVVTIHDLIYRRLPECYTLPDRLIYDFKYGMSCRIADRIIAISECTKADIVDLYRIDPGKIDVVYQGCADSFKRPAPQHTLKTTREKYRLPKRYVIQVGTIEMRKNLELTVKAMQTLPGDVHLVAVGKDRGYLSRVRKIAAQCGVAGRLHILSDVPFSELPALYQQSSAVAYPSRYEGFGIPVLEGLESGKPVVAATGSCLEEAGGEAAFYVNPDNPREMAEALRTALTESPALVSRIAVGKRHASRFNNADVASKVADVYARTLRATGQ